MIYTYHVNTPAKINSRGTYSVLPRVDENPKDPKRIIEPFRDGCISQRTFLTRVTNFKEPFQESQVFNTNEDTQEERQEFKNEERIVFSINFLQFSSQWIISSK